MYSIEGHGRKINYNVDMLKETKIDGKVFALMLEQIEKLETVLIHSDFCSYKEMDQVYKSIN